MKRQKASERTDLKTTSLEKQLPQAKKNARTDWTKNHQKQASVHPMGGLKENTSLKVKEHDPGAGN